METLFMIENAVAVEDGAPKQFKFLPLGLVHSQKGDFLVDNESYSRIRQDFKERGLQIPVDYEHQTLHDVQAPAAGWIKDIILKVDGIYALTDWTERGTEYLRNREYRYCSPVILARESDRKAVKLHSVALTNKPAIDAMTPIVNKAASALDPLEGGKVREDGATLEMIAELLHLPATATLEDIYQVMAALTDNQTTLKLKVDAMEFEAYKTKAEELVNWGLKEGKLAAFQKDWAFRNAMNDIEEFALWLKDSPQVVPMGEIDFGPPLLKEAPPHSRAHDLMGLSAEDIKKYGGQKKRWRI